jgi:hypothetical protein
MISPKAERLDSLDRTFLMKEKPARLCGVIAAKRLGAEQIIILGRHRGRTDPIPATSNQWSVVTPAERRYGWYRRRPDPEGANRCR